MSLPELVAGVQAREGGVVGVQDVEGHFQVVSDDRVKVANGIIDCERERVLLGDGSAIGVHTGGADLEALRCILVVVSGAVDGFLV